MTRDFMSRVTWLIILILLIFICTLTTNAFINAPTQTYFKHVHTLPHHPHDRMLLQEESQRVEASGSNEDEIGGWSGSKNFPRQRRSKAASYGQDQEFDEQQYRPPQEQGQQNDQLQHRIREPDKDKDKDQEQQWKMNQRLAQLMRTRRHSRYSQNSDDQRQAQPVQDATEENQKSMMSKIEKEELDMADEQNTYENPDSQDQAASESNSVSVESSQENESGQQRFRAPQLDDEKQDPDPIVKRPMELDQESHDQDPVQDLSAEVQDRETQRYSRQPKKSGHVTAELNKEHNAQNKVDDHNHEKHSMPPFSSDDSSSSSERQSEQDSHSEDKKHSKEEDENDQAYHRTRSSHRRHRRSDDGENSQQDESQNQDTQRSSGELKDSRDVTAEFDEEHNVQNKFDNHDHEDRPPRSPEDDSSLSSEGQSQQNSEDKEQSKEANQNDQATYRTRSSRRRHRRPDDGENSQQDESQNQDTQRSSGELKDSRDVTAEFDEEHNAQNKFDNHDHEDRLPRSPEDDSSLSSEGQSQQDSEDKEQSKEESAASDEPSRNHENEESSSVDERESQEDPKSQTHSSSDSSEHVDGAEEAIKSDEEQPDKDTGSRTAEEPNEGYERSGENRDRNGRMSHDSQDSQVENSPADQDDDNSEQGISRNPRQDLKDEIENQSTDQNEDSEQGISRSYKNRSRNNSENGEAVDKEPPKSQDSDEKENPSAFEHGILQEDSEAPKGNHEEGQSEAQGEQTVNQGNVDREIPGSEKISKEEPSASKTGQTGFSPEENETVEQLDHKQSDTGNEQGDPITVNHGNVVSEEESHKLISEPEKISADLEDQKVRDTEAFSYENKVLVNQREQDGSLLEKNSEGRESENQIEDPMGLKHNEDISAIVESDDSPNVPFDGGRNNEPVRKEHVISIRSAKLATDGTYVVVSGLTFRPKDIIKCLFWTDNGIRHSTDGIYEASDTLRCPLPKIAAFEDEVKKGADLMLKSGQLLTSPARIYMTKPAGIKNSSVIATQGVNDYNYIKFSAILISLGTLIYFFKRRKEFVSRFRRDLSSEPTLESTRPIVSSLNHSNSVGLQRRKGSFNSVETGPGIVQSYTSDTKKTGPINPDFGTIKREAAAPDIGSVSQTSQDQTIVNIQEIDSGKQVGDEWGDFDFSSPVQGGKFSATPQGRNTDSVKLDINHLDVVKNDSFVGLIKTAKVMTNMKPDFDGQTTEPSSAAKPSTVHLETEPVLSPLGGWKGDNDLKDDDWSKDKKLTEEVSKLISEPGSGSSDVPSHQEETKE